MNEALHRSGHHDRLRRASPRRAGVLAAGLAGTALLAAACGGGSPTAARNTPYQKMVAFAQCMRAHGEPGWPDPDSQGNFAIDRTKDHLAGGSVMQSAQKTCHHLMPNSGPLGSAQQRQMENEGIKFAVCMRSHGITNFPDPTVNAGGVSIRAGSGPGGTKSPQFKSAEQACRKFLAGLGGGGL